MVKRCKYKLKGGGKCSRSAKYGKRCWQHGGNPDDEHLTEILNHLKKREEKGFRGYGYSSDLDENTMRAWYNFHKQSVDGEILKAWIIKLADLRTLYPITFHERNRTNLSIGHYQLRISKSILNFPFTIDYILPPTNPLGHDLVLKNDDLTKLLSLQNSIRLRLDPNKGLYIGDKDNYGTTPRNLFFKLDDNMDELNGRILLIIKMVAINILSSKINIAPLSPIYQSYSIR